MDNDRDVNEALKTLETLSAHTTGTANRAKDAADTIRMFICPECNAKTTRNDRGACAICGANIADLPASRASDPPDKGGQGNRLTEGMVNPEWFPDRKCAGCDHHRVYHERVSDGWADCMRCDCARYEPTDDQPGEGGVGDSLRQIADDMADSLRAWRDEFGTPYDRALDRYEALDESNGWAWWWRDGEIKRCPRCGENALEGEVECANCGLEPEDDMAWRETRSRYLQRHHSAEPADRPAPDGSEDGDCTCQRYAYALDIDPDCPTHGANADEAP